MGIVSQKRHGFGHTDRNHVFSGLQFPFKRRFCFIEGRKFIDDGVNDDKCTGYVTGA